MEKLDKLIELLNEYSLRYIKNKYLINWEIGENPIGIYGYVREYGLGWASKLIIISKEFGFIKWLVDNNKIASDGIKPRDKLVKEITILDQDCNAIGWDNKYTEEEQLLMYLSIQDNPIEFLISVLK